jgi:phosphatidylserine/phosphatidylglycerophosphate/cardiolipin synthase-like enzyme
MLVYSKRAAFLDKLLTKMMHMRHHEIVLVSPFLDLSYISPNHLFGRFLFRASEEGTRIALITRPPDPEWFDPFGQLEAAGITVGFLADLHSKLYIFDVDVDRSSKFMRDMRRSAIIGSANMTERGWGLTSTIRNEEICYLLPDDEYRHARRYAEALRIRARELSWLRMRATSTW